MEKSIYSSLYSHRTQFAANVKISRNEIFSLLVSVLFVFIFNGLFYFSSYLFGIQIDRVHILEDRSLRLENVGLDDMGEYTCEADNAVGAVASTGNLIVYGMEFWFPSKLIRFDWFTHAINFCPLCTSFLMAFFFNK